MQAIAIVKASALGLGRRDRSLHPAVPITGWNNLTYGDRPQAANAITANEVAIGGSSSRTSTAALLQEPSVRCRFRSSAASSSRSVHPVGCLANSCSGV